LGGKGSRVLGGLRAGELRRRLFAVSVAATATETPTPRRLMRLLSGEGHNAEVLCGQDKLSPRYSDVLGQPFPRSLASRQEDVLQPRAPCERVYGRVIPRGQRHVIPQVRTAAVVRLAEPRGRCRWWRCQVVSVAGRTGAHEDLVAGVDRRSSNDSATTRWGNSGYQSFQARLLVRVSGLAAILRSKTKS
jgi:hypothetical protein